MKIIKPKILPPYTIVYDKNLANKITKEGKCILNEMLDRLKELGYNTDKIKRVKIK